MTREVALTRGMVALVDDSDFEAVSAYSWCAARPAKTWYAQTNIRFRDGRRTFTMHRLLCPAPPGMVVDHVDRNGLNNVRANLRIANRCENARNRIRECKKTSRYRGVSWVGDRIQHWRAQIQSAHSGKVTIGFFSTEFEAALAWDETAGRLFGDFAVLNFPKERA